MASIVRIDVDDPNVGMDLAQRLLHRCELFTGEVADYQSGRLVSLDEYTDGVLNGQARAWYVDGTLRSEGVMREGFPAGEFQQWHPNGRLAARAIMSESGLRQLAQYEWDEEGNLTKEWRGEGMAY
ncbi:hypothetical protein AB0C59_24700 [Streptomyces sp. NPDC048664]|uniref:toxin-antitoxin system YwqK family antitoxin n=1 Tax=Streptomyces sp. NPDC048664 TaxID=3154505 RepID=UPI003420C3DF